MKPVHSKKTLRRLIREKKYFIRFRNVLAEDDLGWSEEKILKAILLLKTTDCYDSRQKTDNPQIWYDYYRATGIMRENIYTHFYVENDTLVIDSFKRRYKE